jgi:hypothetical protein
MSSFRILEDYASGALTRKVLPDLAGRIRRDFERGLIDRENFEELLSDLRDLELDWGVLDTSQSTDGPRS